LPEKPLPKGNGVVTIHTILVPVADLNRPAYHTLAYARSLTDRVTAVYIADNDEHKARMRQKWDAWGSDIPLVVLDSPYRAVVGPLMRYIEEVDALDPDDLLTIVLPEMVPEMVPDHWWDNAPHNQTALRLKAALLFRPNTVVTSVPYHMRGADKR